MTSIQQRLSTGRDMFTTGYPDLGADPVNYEDSVSPDFFAAKREAVFKRNWLCIGRIERLPRKGSHLTRELPGNLAWLPAIWTTPGDPFFEMVAEPAV